ncbi:MAG: protein jag [Dehalococcoidia bacterium]|nr:protein jag [Dehalococcoidia bacterium]
MRQIEISAHSVEEAIELALQELGVERAQASIEVLAEGKGGMFGLGREDAHIRATLLEASDDRVYLAKELLSELLAHLELPADITAGVGVASDDGEAAPITLDINGDELGILIGRRGQTLAAMQYVLRLMLAQKLNASAPLVLDVNGYKKRRSDSLRTLAQHIAEQVSISQRSFALEPMPAYERRIIHLALSGHPSVMTQSVGFGDARKVTVVPKGRSF